MYQTGLPAEIGPQVTIDLFICNGLLPKLMDNVFDTGEGSQRQSENGVKTPI